MEEDLTRKVSAAKRLSKDSQNMETYIRKLKKDLDKQLEAGTLQNLDSKKDKIQKLKEDLDRELAAVSTQKISSNDVLDQISKIKENFDTQLASATEQSISLKDQIKELDKKSTMLQDIAKEIADRVEMINRDLRRLLPSDIKTQEMGDKKAEKAAERSDAIKRDKPQNKYNAKAPVQNEATTEPQVTLILH